MTDKQYEGIRKQLLIIWKEGYNQFRLDFLNNINKTS